VKRLANGSVRLPEHAMQGRADVKNVTVIRDCNGQEPAHRVSTSYPQVFGLSVSMTGKVVAPGFPIDPWDTYNLRIPSHERHASRCPGADSQVTCELVHTQIDRAPLLLPSPSFLSVRGTPWSANTSFAATKTRMAGRVVT
jgi:hypothetical protein